jgi:hypothetical protein
MRPQMALELCSFYSPTWLTVFRANTATSSLYPAPKLPLVKNNHSAGRKTMRCDHRHLL